MTRPLYETNADLRNERSVAAWLGDLWRAYPQKLPKSYAIDFGMVRQKEVAAWVEVKCRDNPMGQYPTLAISLKKITTGLELSEWTTKPFLLVVRWTDATAYMHVSTRDQFTVEIGGRKDRGDWQDMEPMAHFPTESFQLLGAA